MSTVCLYDITNEKLGKGHFAVVKLAKHCLTGELVAVKIIDKLRLNNENLQQLGQEIRLLSRLSEKEHPNIVKLYQVIDTKTKLYLVLEYPGREVCDLYDFIEKNNTRNGLTEKVAKHVFKQIVSAVSYCHNCGIVHRDLKPENILVVNQPEEISLKNRIEYPIVKLIDFGFSNQWMEGQKLRTSCGTLAFSSPEILLNCEYEGDKVDIWGLGCILYILLYGSSPFMQLNDSETLIKILDCSFNTPQRPNVNEHSINLIRSLLRKDPKSRLTIKQILEHPWLKEETQQQSPLNEEAELICEQKDVNNKENLNKTTEQLDDEMLELKKKLSSVDNNDKLLIRNFDDKLHENVIEQMINKGMIDSKEQIENAIKTCSHKLANTSKLEIVKKIIPNKDELTNEQTSKDQEDEKRDCFNTDNKLINQFHLEEYNSLAKEDAEKAYLTATYNLLKDKIYREQQGINLTNQIQSKLIHHKKVLPTRPRRSIIKQPQFGLTSSSSASNSRPDSANSCELNEIPLSSINQLPEEQTNQKLNDFASKVAGINELPVYEEDNGFMLPLARKCSIVSEEGSCIVSDSGNEYSSDINSAHNSISNYNSLNDYTFNAELNKVRSHSYINSNTNQSSNNSSKRNSRENLKIQSMPIVNIVIQDFSNTIEEDERLEIDEFNNCTFSKVDDNNDEENELIDDNDRKLDSNNSNYFCPQLNSLHQASSSPDLNRQEKLDEDKSDQIISKQDEDKNENAFDEHMLNQLNQSTNSKTSSLHTSMRIIMQSKSCNSILCSGLNNKDEHCSNCELNKQQDEKEEEKKLIEQQQQNNQLNLSVKDDQLSTKSNKSTNLNIFDKVISKFNVQKDDTKRLSLNLEPEDKDNLHSTNRFTIRKCKKDKISCCAIS